MIKSLYFRMFFLGLPGLYLALWLSRFSLSMINALPYYYGMIMTAISFFSGMLICFILYPQFHKFFNRNMLQIILTGSIFIISGHLFDLMDAGIDAYYEIIYYFAGLTLLGFFCCLFMQFKLKKEKNTILGAFIIGSIISYFIGIKYFEQSDSDIYLGISVFIIMFFYQIIFSHYRSWQKTCLTLILVLINIALCIKIHFVPIQKFNSLTNLGYYKLTVKGDAINITDHRKRIFTSNKNINLQTIADLSVYQLQANKNKLDMLYIGYPGSLTPFYLFHSPFKNRIDLYFWDLTIPKNLLQATINPYHFYISDWNFFKNFKQKKYDLIIIENIPSESESSRRIFIHYAKQMLNQPNGVIAFPESLARKYDGQYIKATADSSMVMLMGGESTENVNELEKRCNEFLKNNLPQIQTYSHNLPETLITNIDTTNTTATYENEKFIALFNPLIWRLIIWTGLVLYLIFRLWKCRYKNNQNGFFAFEAGFTFCMIIFSSLMLLSELRLVYPYFTPALFGISVMVMLPLNNKKTAFVMQTAIIALLFYYTSINFVRAFPPIYLVPILLPLSFIAIANTLHNSKMQSKSNNSDQRYIYFTLGILFTLLLLFCAKNNNLYPTLIYIALISRFFYYFKI